jgi:inosine-uridine nucleoside N-ribohydrolase
VITEAQLNQQIAQALAQRPDAPFREVRARLLGGNMVDVIGITAVAGREVAVTVRLRLTMAGSALNLDIVEAQAGPFPVPAGLAEALARQAAQAAGLPGLQGVALPAEVQSVEIREGVVAIGLRGP